MTSPANDPIEPTPPAPPPPPVDDPDPDPDQAWKALGLVNDWIRHAETKTAATLAAAGVTGGVLYNLIKSVTNPNGWLDLCAVLCGLSVIASAASALIALLPRLTTQPVRGRKQRALNGADPVNLLFYADIARQYPPGAAEYADVLATLTTNRADMVAHIAHQVQANATVGTRKFRWANRALIALGVALTFLAITALTVAHY